MRRRCRLGSLAVSSLAGAVPAGIGAVPGSRVRRRDGLAESWSPALLPISSLRCCLTLENNGNSYGDNPIAGRHYLPGVGGLSFGLYAVKTRLKHYLEW